MLSKFNPSDLLKSVGLKVTKNREQVLLILNESERPLNHQEIMQKLPKNQTWDRVTIYRTLADLESKNLLNCVLNNDRVTYFELKNYKNTSIPGHSHLICDSCGTITCITDIDREIPKNLKGYRIHSMEVNYHGICKNCQS